MRTSLIFLVSLATIVTCHPLLFHLEKNGARAPALLCPDLKSQCPDGNTCCKLENVNVTGYGCCPLPQAVCCKDGILCCPHSYTCSEFSRTCNKLDSTVPMVKRLPSVAVARPVKNLFNIICPDDQTDCPDGDTCCKNADGSYGCCELADAECCSDELHCCPSGYTCNLSSRSCEKSGSVRPLIKKRPRAVAWNGDGFEKRPTTKSPKNVVCPDQMSECSSNSTCCKLASGQYGCCPEPNAVCCSDKEHCCPHDYACQNDGTCTDGHSVIAALKKKLAKMPQNVCPDQKSECPSNATCCPLKSGAYGCCKEPKAVCCADMVHCCPEGFTCETDKGMCTKGDSTVPVLKKQPAIKKRPTIEHPQNVVCPDKTSECSSDSTCCKLASGQYGCCPEPNAVCCSDRKHCCPQNYKCQNDGKCTNGNSVIVALKKNLATVRKLPHINTATQNVMCGDNKTYCADGNTCCELASKKFGCCPMANAVCCSDGIHCCPSGFTCDVANQVCSKGKIVLSLLKKIAPIKVPQNVVCPDKSECSSNSTCCLLKSGQYGCCPEPEAVCCADRVHCCPKGFTCQTEKGTCTKGDSTIPMLKKQSAFNMPQGVVCPDGLSECPDNSTCCSLKSAPGRYGCCKLPNAVCCEDKEHCCPENYVCKESSGMCIKGDSIVPVVKKQPATLHRVPYKRPLAQDDQNLPALDKSRIVICPDDNSICPDGCTCCEVENGKYGCCNYTNAVCCADGVHCCPQDYICDLSEKKCVSGEVVLPLSEKKSAELTQKKDASVGELLVALSPAVYEPQKYIPCGNNYFCQDGQTCCPGSGVPWMCCPMLNAVCCDDREHCCDANYTCMKDQCYPKVSARRLQLALSSKEAGKSAQTIKEKVPATKSPQNIVCPDQTSECSSNSTCCLLKSGQYGCCPEPNAVCCTNGLDCCPKGYKCQNGGTCTKGDSIIPVLKKLPAITKAQYVKCPDSSECPDKSTCCQLKSGQYGCCPQENGVCCSDDVHCCPEGYTCDVAHGTCTKGPAVTAMLQKQLQPIISTPQNVICPDEENQCPDGNTCCPTDSSYACCPSPNAVCCEDKEHCCPQGYTCDALTQSCDNEGVLVPYLKSQLAIKKVLAIKLPQNVVCPDGTSECANNSTCCLSGPGVYGCCPLPKAVCCQDEKHCCPEGFTCDGNRGCTKGKSVIPVLKKQRAVVAPFLKAQRFPGRHQDKIEHDLL